MSKLLNPRIIELEGMAMIGMVKKARMEPCGSGYPEGWKKIVAELTDGSVYETGCMEPDAARRNYMVLTLYIRNWSKLIWNGEEA